MRKKFCISFIKKLPLKTTKPEKMKNSFYWSKCTYLRTTLIINFDKLSWHFSTEQSKLTFENLVISTVVCLQLNVLCSNIHQGPSWNLRNLCSFLNFSFKDLTYKNVSLKVFKFATKHINLYITQPCLHTLMQARLLAKQSTRTILVLLHNNYRYRYTLCM